MTATTHSHPIEPATAPDQLPERPTAVPLLRLIRVELRKLADTRAGWWLLAVMGLLAAVTVAILLFAGEPAEQTFVQFFAFGLLPSAVLLPVLGILSMTSEWSQRTALTTFALVPQRSRVLVAKLAAAVLIALAVTAITVAVAAVGNLLAIEMDGDGSWKFELAVLGRAVLAQVIYVLMGSAFGALLLNTPLAIVLYFALPMAWSFLGGMIKSLHTAAQWLDLNVTSAPLIDPSLGGVHWTRLAVSVAVWLLVPLVAGTFRVLRREIS